MTLGLASLPTSKVAGFERSVRRRTLSEEESVAMAAVVWFCVAVAPAASATWAIPVFVFAVLLAAIAVAVARMKALVLAIGLIGLALGARAQVNYQPMGPGQIETTGVVMTDPKPSGIGWRVQGRLESDQRVELLGFGVDGFELRQMSVGQRFSTNGRAKSANSSWEKSRHIVGSIMVDRIRVIDDPPLWVRATETARNAVLTGAERLPGEQQALYTGLVLGDDRFQSIGQRARFRAVGLSHLLAVSGQNVAFFLAIARPGLRFLGFRSRFIVTVALLCLFVLVTRGEPSVLRATATGGLSAWAAMTGRHRSGIRLLATTVTLLIAFDPFLVDVVGFQLSVAASAGILLLVPSLRERLPGPLVWRETLGVTTAAQLAVTPLLLYHFGPSSLAAIPANMLAGWAAAGVMVLGLTAGTIAGFLPEQLGQGVQLPNRLMLWWLDEVARQMARLETPSLGAVEFVAIVGLLVGLVIVRSRTARTVMAVSYLAAVLTFSVPKPPETPTNLAPGAEFVPGLSGHPSILILRGNASVSVVDELLARQITEIDFVVSERGHRQASLLVGGVEDVVEVGVILAPPQHGVRNARRLTTTLAIASGFGEVSIEVPKGRDGVGSTALVVNHDLTVE